MKTFGKEFFGKGMELKTEVTNGKCPICQETTVFVSIFSHIYRCITCGADTKQKVNGVIQFMPIAASGVGKQPVMKLMNEDGPDKA
jgi:uncharacterized protein (DUF983 family)